MAWKIPKVSRVEIVIALGFIVLLFTFAIPQYQCLQMKARQQEVLTLLSSFYSASGASRIDPTGYAGNFVATGFAPGGIVHYSITSADNPNNDFGDPLCVATYSNCDSVIKTFKTWVDQGAVPVTKSIVTNDAFLVIGSGYLKRGGEVDEWTIDQNKVLKNINSGL